MWVVIKEYLGASVEDLIGPFATEEEAEAYAQSQRNEYDPWTWDVIELGAPKS